MLLSYEQTPNAFESVTSVIHTLRGPVSAVFSAVLLTGSKITKIACTFHPVAAVTQLPHTDLVIMQTLRSRKKCSFSISVWATDRT